MFVMSAVTLKSIQYSEQHLLKIAKALKPVGTRQLLVKTRRIRFERAATCTMMLLKHPSLVPDKKLIKDLGAIKRTSLAIIREAGRMITSKGHALPVGIPISLIGDVKPQPKRLQQAVSKLLRLFELTTETAVDGISGDLQPFLMIRADGDELNLRDLLVDIMACLDSDKNLDRTICAAHDLRNRADLGEQAVKRLRANMVRKGNSGDAALNFWVDDMLNLYEKVTRRPVTTAVGNVNSPLGGIAHGPLIDFLDAAIVPLMPQFVEAGVLKDKLYGDAWRSRIRTAQKYKAQNSS